MNCEHFSEIVTPFQHGLRAHELDDGGSVLDAAHYYRSLFAFDLCSIRAGYAYRAFYLYAVLSRMGGVVFE